MIRKLADYIIKNEMLPAPYMEDYETLLCHCENWINIIQSFKDENKVFKIDITESVKNEFKPIGQKR